MYRIAICDDDRSFCVDFEKSLRGVLSEKITEYSITSFSDTDAFLDVLKKGDSYHLVFLDVLFETGNGIDFARSLRAQGYSFDLIFITVSRDYAIESFGVDPLYYILKPVSMDTLKAAIERFLNKNEPASVSFTTSHGMLHIRITDIVYFEVLNHSVIIHKSDGTFVTFRGTLREVEGQLPPAKFIKPHRSYLVNLEHIGEFSYNGIRVTHGTVIPVSRKLYNKVRLEFIEYLGRSDIHS